MTTFSVQKSIFERFDISLQHYQVGRLSVDIIYLIFWIVTEKKSGKFIKKIYINELPFKVGCRKENILFLCLIQTHTLMHSRKKREGYNIAEKINLYGKTTCKLKICPVNNGCRIYVDIITGEKLSI